MEGEASAKALGIGGRAQRPGGWGRENEGEGGRTPGQGGCPEPDQGRTCR